MRKLTGGGKANEFTFQNDVINQLVANGWLLGKPDIYSCVLTRCNGAELIKERGAI